MSNPQTCADLEKTPLMGYYSGMAQKGHKKRKKSSGRCKNGVPVLSSDQDFLEVFETKPKPPQPDKPGSASQKPYATNRHGVKVLDKSASADTNTGPDENEDFSVLLDEFSRKKKSSPLKKARPVPLKKRLKRYPPPEVELDLHGFSVLNAQVKVKSFLLTCKKRGFFTARIIVGKGLHSDVGPVLPDVVEDILVQMRSQGIILWHEWDRKKRSRSGALIAYIKQFEQFE